MYLLLLDNNKFSNKDFSKIKTTNIQKSVQLLRASANFDIAHLLLLNSNQQFTDNYLFNNNIFLSEFY